LAGGSGNVYRSATAVKNLHANIARVAGALIRRPVDERRQLVHCSRAARATVELDGALLEQTGLRLGTRIFERWQLVERTPAPGLDVVHRPRAARPSTR
ncbi:hypothetical protein, partial [Flavobacterium chungangensis]